MINLILCATLICLLAVFTLLLPSLFPVTSLLALGLGVVAINKRDILFPISIPAKSRLLLSVMILYIACLSVLAASRLADIPAMAQSLRVALIVLLVIWGTVLLIQRQLRRESGVEFGKTIILFIPALLLIVLQSIT